MTITAHPLHWPAGWKRTEPGYIEISRFRDRTIAKARIYVADQVRLMGGESLVVSSNIELRNDGLPRSGQKQPVDRGVAVYFIRKGRSMCFACDKWAFVEDNLWAIGRTVEALRQIERDGSSDMLERAFTGFAALPAPDARNWWDVLGVPSFASTEQIKAAFRNLAKIHHPDAGGSAFDFVAVNTAYQTAMKERGLA